MNKYGIIYKIINKINGKIYIGQTTEKRGFRGRYYCSGEGIERVYNYYISRKKNNDKYNEHLLNAIEKYGFEAFEVIEEFDIAYSEEELNELEKKYIKEFNSIENGYNHREGGDNGKFSEEAIRNIRLGKKDNLNDRKVICLNTLKVFDSIKQAKELHERACENISYCCSGKRKYCGQLEDGTKLVWRYYEDYLIMTKEEIEETISLAQKPFRGENCVNGKKVVCLNTKEVFNSVRLGSQKYNIKEENISKCCKNERKSCGVLNGEKLVWRYYEDYLTMSEDEIKRILYNIDKRVINIQTKQIFDNPNQANKNTGVKNIFKDNNWIYLRDYRE